MRIPTAYPESEPTELEQIYRLYLGLVGQRPEAGLGGRLLYAGEPDEPGSRLLRAANIAGAASLAASAEARSVRQSMREGAIDFVVNSLDEALRILKNQVRKREPVAVGVSVAPAALLREMLERGVLPDVLASKLPPDPALDIFAEQGARIVAPGAIPDGMAFQTLTVPSAFAQRVAAFDALLLSLLPSGDAANRRWLQLSPRYLPVSARRLRSLACGGETASQIAALMSQLAVE